MAEYIDKGWALATACSGLTREIEGERWIRVDEVRASLNAAPTIEAEPKPMHWIDTAECRFKYSMDSRFRCSVCGKGYDFKHRFCPNCGKKADNPSGVILKVKMDEVEE